MQEKEQEKEEVQSEPIFRIGFSPLEDGTAKVRIRDKRTDEKCSFIVKDVRRFFETYDVLSKEKHLAKLSLDDYVKRLKNGVD